MIGQLYFITWNGWLPGPGSVQREKTLMAAPGPDILYVGAKCLLNTHDEGQEYLHCTCCTGWW